MEELRALGCRRSPTSQTWQAPAFSISSPNHGCCADSSLAYDSRGRLFWSYLGAVFDGEGNIIGLDIFFSRCDPVSGEILPGYPVNVTASASINKPASSGFNHDKQWLAADIYPASPFRDRLYMTWTEFEESGNTIVWTIHTTDQGLTWSVPLRLSENSEGFVWPVHNTVAPNGDVYVAYHETDSVLSGTRGRALVLRSTNGGETYPQKTAAFARGNADVTFNVQDQTGAIPGTFFQTPDGAFDPTPLELGGLGITNNPVSVVAADLDGDGDLDLANVDQVVRLTVFFQVGPGSFDPTPLTLDTNGYSVAAGDFDGDGDLEIVSANGESLKICFQTDPGTFDPTPLTVGSAGTSSGPVAVAVGDADGDGDFDLASANGTSGNLTVFFQSAARSFDPIPLVLGSGITDNPVSVVAADLDGDGDLDLASADRSGELAVFWGGR